MEQITSVVSRVIKLEDIQVAEEKRELIYPGMEVQPKLTVERDGDIVRGFHYACACGHTDHFICE